MTGVSGSLSIACRNRCYTIRFEENGWIAGEMLQYLDDVFRAESPEVGILRLLGYTLQFNDGHPSRTADHWVEVDLDKRKVATNSELLRKAVRKEKPDSEEVYWAPALDRIYAVLDRNDFTVELYS